MGSYMCKNGGGYIRYPDIKKSEQFVLSDGVHLTGLGNEVFLNTLQGALVYTINAYNLYHHYTEIVYE
jgi:hypothetical protein